MYNVLGIDGATHSSGYSVFDMETGDLVDYGVVSGGDSENSLQRINVIIQEFKKIIKEYNIRKVVAEAPIAWRKNITTLMVLCNLQGAISQMCYDMDISCQFVEVGTWRAKLEWERMDRESYKEQSIQFANEMFGLNLVDEDDIADAINLSYATIWMKLPRAY